MKTETKILTVDGVTYIETEGDNGGCLGCVANGDDSLCGSLPCDDNMIFVVAKV